MTQTFNISPSFLQKALYYSLQFEHSVYLNGNHYQHGFPNVLAFGAVQVFEPKTSQNFQALKEFTQTCTNNCYGYFSYDLKNELEPLQSKHKNLIDFPLISFFEAGNELKFNKNQVTITHKNPQQLFEKIDKVEIPTKNSVEVPFFARVSKEKYLNNIESIQQHILEGDIYELNYCIEFFNENIQIDPIFTYQKLNKLSATPFSCFVKTSQSYLMSATPERFIKKERNKIISQPIKGTAPRGKNIEEDEVHKKKLRENPKEQAENLMIVDLVRNDLARTAQTGSVKVDELFGIYTFPQVHQMISTVSSELHQKYHFIDAIKEAFPMGSMTGAPKIKAMELIDQYENSRRGLFSGAVGYITPDGEFDFNVIIRSIFYNQKNNYLSFQVGSAITYDSIGEKEYEECLLKAKAIIECLRS